MAGTVTPKKLTPEIEEDMVRHFDYLAARREDEKAYESVRAYAKAFERKFVVKVLKFKTEPLAFSFRYGEMLCALMAAPEEIRFTKTRATLRTPPKARRKKEAA